MIVPAPSVSVLILAGFNYNECMNDKRKKQLQARQTRHRKYLQQRQPKVQRIAGKDLSIQKEVEYITMRAAEGDGRCVALGSLVLFSTPTGDAWMLDPADGLALCLARGGEPQPRRIVETVSKFAIEWDRTYVISGGSFTITEKQTGRTTTTLDYPTDEIEEVIRMVRGQSTR
jgi:hypothetical protein